MKISHVLTEAMVYGPPGSRAMGMGNFGALTKFYTKPSARTSENLLLSYGNDNFVDLPESDVDKLADYYNQLPSQEAKQQFVLGPMAMYGEFLKVARRLKLSVSGRPPAQPPLPFEPRQGDLFEKETGIDRGAVKSSELSVLLKRAYARYPQAQNDVEALLLYDLDQQKNTKQNFSRTDKVNQRQDDVMRQLSDLTKRQSQQIAALDAENDELSDELDRIEREIPAMTAQVAAQPAAIDQPKPASAERDAAKKEREAAKAQRKDQAGLSKSTKTAKAKSQPDQEKKPEAKKKDQRVTKGERRTAAKKASDDAAAAYTAQQEKELRAQTAAEKERERAQRAADREQAKKDREERAAKKQSQKAMATTVKSLATPREPQVNRGPTVPTTLDKSIGGDNYDDESDTGSIPWTIRQQAADAVKRASQPSVQTTTENRYEDEKIGGRYDPDDFDAMVLRLKQRAQRQERERGPVDLARLAQRLRDIDTQPDKSR